MDRRPRPISEVPDARDHRDEIARAVRRRRPAVFLDYDGTLTPIVDDPAEATIDDDVRRVITGLAAVCPVAVVSGRDLDDVREHVGLDGLHYAGSHGFDMLAADGTVTQPASDHLASLDAAEDRLREATADLAGVRVERKRFAIAVHTRGASPEAEDAVGRHVRRAADEQGDLRVTGGKRILELRPDLDWDKGRALETFLGALGLDGDDVLPVFIGDDVTDEDAMRVVVGRGLALVVRGEDDERRTVADYTLADPDGTVTFLADLRDLVAG